jgi:hypothetical protein
MKLLRFADVANQRLAAAKRVFIRADLNVAQDHSATGDLRIRNAWVPSSNPGCGTIVTIAFYDGDRHLHYRDAIEFSRREPRAWYLLVQSLRSRPDTVLGERQLQGRQVSISH